MFAVAFDLVVDDTRRNHPKGVAQPCKDIEATLGRYKFERRQGSVYTTGNEDLANLFAALAALKAMAWFPASVGDIRAFRVEQWSDFTAFMKS